MAVSAARPAGTVILAVVLLLGGLWFAWHVCYPLVLVLFSAERVVLHPTWYVMSVRDGLAGATGVVGAVGLIWGRAFGWWLAIVHLYWRLAQQCVLPILRTVVAQTTSDSQFQPVFLPSVLIIGLVMALIVVYLQKDNVRAFYCIASNRAVTNVTMVVSCVGAGLVLDFAFILTHTY